MVSQHMLDKDYDLNEFHIIPANELVNVVVIIGERWLEDNPFPTDDIQDNVCKAIECLNKGNTESNNPPGPLNYMVLQLKFNTKAR